MDGVHLSTARFHFDEEIFLRLLKKKQVALNENKSDTPKSLSSSFVREAEYNLNSTIYYSYALTMTVMPNI